MPQSQRAPGEKWSRFGRRVDEACRDIGITPTRLASIVGMSDSYISRLLEKEPRIDASDFSLAPKWSHGMVEVLGVRWEWLFYDRGDRWGRHGKPSAEAAGVGIAMFKGYAHSAIGNATAFLHEQRFESDDAWRWFEMIRDHTLAEHGQKGMVILKKRIADEQERRAQQTHRRRFKAKKRAASAGPISTRARAAKAAGS